LSEAPERRFPPVSTAEFKLEHLFGSKTRARLLGLFLMNPGTAFFVRELTRKIDAQLNSVRRELKNLIELGLVLEVEGEAGEKRGHTLADKKKFYTGNVEFVLFDDLRAMFKKVQIFVKNNLVQDLEKRGTIDFLAFTGRFVDRTNMPTDIIVVGSIDPADLQKAIAQFEGELGHEINYTLLTKEEFLYRRQVTDRFLMNILDGEKIVTINHVGV
jgi:hypothetical protein